MTVEDFKSQLQGLVRQFVADEDHDVVSRYYVAVAIMQNVAEDAEETLDWVLSAEEFSGGN